jgi:hypothetical protein
VEKARPGGIMRSIYEIQKDIEKVSHHLNILILEKKLTLQVLWEHERAAEIITEKVIEKMKK